MLENRNNERTANAVDNKEMLLVGDVETTQSPTNPYTPGHDSRFLRCHASLNSESDYRTNAGSQNKWEPPTQ